MAFYAPVFGWRAADMDQGAGTMIQVPGYGDHLAATVDPGIHERQASAPPGFADVIGGLVVIGAGEAPHWHVTFTVADRDDSAATAERLGATIVAVVRRHVDQGRAACATRRAPSSPSASSPRPTATGRTAARPSGHGPRGALVLRGRVVRDVDRHADLGGVGRPRRRR